MTFIKIRIFLISAPFCLSACATTNMGTQQATFGQAVKANIAAHAVTPNQADKNNTYIPADQARQALAIEKYKKNEAETPQPARTINE